MLTKKSGKICKKYICEVCDYITSDKNDFNKHCSTRKHKNLTNLTQKSENTPELYICCKCNKQYKSRMGLWSHSKKCEAPTK